MNCSNCQKNIDSAFMYCYDCHLKRVEELRKITRCMYCQKPLVKIGNERKNGASIADWDTRIYHKKCYKELNNLHNSKKHVSTNCNDAIL
jgi:hypothetical protein